MRSRSTLVLTVIALAACLFVSFATAQTKPNLSGAWKMNAEKSKFASGGPDGILIKVDHKEPALTEDWSISTPNGERAFVAKYTTDGKETEQQVMGRTAKTSAKWDGDALVIEFKAEDGYFNRKITLSADGKTLTMMVSQRGDGGQGREETVVFDKQ